tara:strand:- start:120 stop:617 length:498 start_codon:yes stop_codon:yes gene_type:complete
MDYTLSNNDRLQLDKMLKANDVEDSTELIRRTKHSNKIREDVKQLLNLKKENKKLYNSNFQKFDELAVQKCSFLFNNYTDIYNKVIKDELDINILNKFLAALEQIEDGKLDQHEASVKVGSFLKELYIDSALKVSEKNDSKQKEKKRETEIEYENISWSDYKNII